VCGCKQLQAVAGNEKGCQQAAGKSLILRAGQGIRTRDFNVGKEFYQIVLSNQSQTTQVHCCSVSVRISGRVFDVWRPRLNVVLTTFDWRLLN